MFLSRFTDIGDTDIVRKCKSHRISATNYSNLVLEGLNCLCEPPHSLKTSAIR